MQDYEQVCAIAKRIRARHFLVEVADTQISSQNRLIGNQNKKIQQKVHEPECFIQQDPNGSKLNPRPF